MQPFKSTERRELTARGSLKERLAFANRIGNHKIDSFRFKQAIIRTARQHLQSKGVSETRLKQLFPMLAPPPAWHGMPTTGSVKIFTLLIEFADYQHKNAANTIQGMLFGSPTTGKPYESLANYYKRASYNKLDLSGGTTLGWYKTSKKRSDIQTDNNGRDSLIKEALLYFKAQGHNFTQYDNNNDGVIDYFMVFWTGPDTGWGTFWWGYTTEFSDASFKLDGKSLKKYSWQWESNPVGTAFSPRVVIHETGHALGLPDLYDYDGELGPDGGVGGADMMDANWLDHNCFSKWMLDWLSPIVIGSGTQTLALNPSGTSEDCVAIWPDLDSGEIFSEFFMVQNRQHVGNDTELTGQGLLIWHVDARLDSSGSDFVSNNSYTPHKLVRLMEADGLEDIEANRGFDVDDLYTQGKTIDPSTTPSSIGYGKSSYVEVSNITASGSQLSAIFKIKPVLTSPRVPARSQIGVVSRSTDKLDIFVTDRNGVIFTAAWEPAFTDWWHGWWELNGGRAAPGAPVHGVSRSTDKLDVFVIGTDNRVYTAAWEPAFTDWWHGWWQLKGGIAAPGAHVTVVSRNTDKLDAFVVGTDGRIYTAAWEPGFTDWWHGWWPIGDIRAPQGAPVHVVSRSADKLDIFVTDVNGVIQTAAWEPAFTDGWHGWWELNGGRAAPGAPVTAVSRSTDKLDVFVVGTDGRIYTAAWEPSFTDWWHGWWPIGDIRAPQGAPVHAVSRSADKLDIFVTDVNGVIQTAAWEPAFTDGWHGWWELNGGRAAPGAPVTAVSRSTDKLDVFVIGSDGRVWTAAWEPSFPDWWHGWWPIGE